MDISDVCDKVNLKLEAKRANNKRMKKVRSTKRFHEVFGGADTQPEKKEVITVTSEKKTTSTKNVTMADLLAASAEELKERINCCKTELVVLEALYKAKTPQ